MKNIQCLDTSELHKLQFLCFVHNISNCNSQLREALTDYCVVNLDVLNCQTKSENFHLDRSVSHGTKALDLKGNSTLKIHRLK